MARILLAIVLVVVGWLVWGGDAETARRARAPASQLAPPPVRASEPRPPEPPSASSVVVQTEAGEPIDGAVVEALTEDGWVPVGRTRADGRIEWTRRPERGQALRVLHPRVAIGTLWGWEPGKPLRVADGHPFAVRVLAPDGKPVAEARVRATFVAFQRDEDGRENRQALGWQEFTTGDGGLAPFAGLPEGGIEIHVRVVHVDYPVYHNQWEFNAGALPIAKAWLNRGATIAGRVLDIHGDAVPGAIVSIGEKRVACDEIGRYEMQGASDRDTPTASKPGVGIGEYGVLGPEQSISRELKISPGERREGIDIRLWPVSRITGRVRAAGVTPIEAATYTAVGVYLPGLVGRLSGDIGADGTFESDEFYVLRTNVVPLDVESTSHATARTWIEVKPGQDVDAGEIVLDAMGELSGLVVDAQEAPLAGGYVEVANVRAMVAKDGTFHVRGVPAGTWAVVRYDGRTRPDGISTLVVVEEGRRAEGVRIVVAAPGTLTGVVKDQDGQPYAGVQVAAVPPGIPPAIDTRKWGSYTTDAHGRFRIEGLAPARYQVAVVDTERGIESGFRIDDRMEPVSVDLTTEGAEIELVVFRRGRVTVGAKGMDDADYIGQFSFTLVRVSVWLETAGRKFWTVGAFHRSSYFDEGTSGSVAILEAGTHVLTLGAHGRAGWVSDVMDLSPTSQVDLGTIRLARGRRVVATVRKPDGGPAEGAWVRLHSGALQTALGGWRASADESGRVVFEHIAEGDFHLLVTFSGAAPRVVLLPKSGDADLRVKLSEGRTLTLQLEEGAGNPQRGHTYELFDAKDGRYLGDYPGPGVQPLVVPNAPEGELRIVASVGGRLFEARVGAESDTATIIRLKSK